MADFDYDGQPEEIDEFAMFRARALGAESEYLLLKQASRRGNNQNGTSDQAGAACNGAADGQSQPMVRTSSGRRRHASGQGGSSQSRSRRLAASGSGASLEQQQNSSARRADTALTETVSAQHMLLLSPGSFDEDNENDARQRPLQRTHSCRSAVSRSHKSANNNNHCQQGPTEGAKCPNAVQSERISPSDEAGAHDTNGAGGGASSKFNRSRTMTMPVRRRSRSSGAGGGSGSARTHRSPAAGDQSPTHLNHQPQSTAAADQLTDVAGAAVGHDVAVVRVRTFTTKSGSVVNRGDSIKIRNRGAAGGSGRIAAARASPAGAHHPGVQRSSSTSDSRPTSPGATAGNLTRTANGSARDRREALSRHSSSRGGKSGSQSGEDVDQISPSGNMSAAVTSVGDQLQHEANNSNTAKCAAVDDNDIELSSSGGVTAGPESENGRTNGTQCAARSQQLFPADNEAPAPPVYKVLVLGSQGVGKTTLVEQLMTSEYLANQENCNSGDDDTADKLVSVQVDDEESTIQFIDIPGAQANKSRDLVDANLVVYSVTDRLSFQHAQSCLQELRPAKRHNVVILVANKQDIVRNRVISEEDGKNLAARRHCKFIEVSALLDHKMDELLVGITRQIRLRKSHPRCAPQPAKESGSGGLEAPVGCLQRAAVAAFRKLFRRRGPIEATSCDDLFTP